MKEYSTFVTHLECSFTGKTYPADQLHGLSEAGKPLLVRYDLDALGKAIKNLTWWKELRNSGATVSFCLYVNQKM